MPVSQTASTPLGRHATAGVHGQHAHAEAGAAAADLFADVAEADNSERHVGKARMREVDRTAFARPGSEGRPPALAANGVPTSFFLPADVGVQIAAEAGDVAEDLIGDGIGEQAPHVGELARVIDEGGEDVVLEAGGGRLHPAQLRRCFEQARGELAEEGVRFGYLVERFLFVGAVDDGHVSGGFADALQARGVDVGIDDEFHS